MMPSKVNCVLLGVYSCGGVTRFSPFLYAPITETNANASECYKSVERYAATLQPFTFEQDDLIRGLSLLQNSLIPIVSTSVYNDREQWIHTRILSNRYSFSLENAILAYLALARDEEEQTSLFRSKSISLFRFELHSGSASYGSVEAGILLCWKFLGWEDGEPYMMHLTASLIDSLGLDIDPLEYVGGEDLSSEEVQLRRNLYWKFFIISRYS